MSSTTSTVLLLPGWLDSGPSHWQSRWENRYRFQRVQQHDWQRPLRGDWLARLDEVIANHLSHATTPSPTELLTRNSSATVVDPPGIVLVAHSLGCHLVAAWAAASRHTAAVRGALLVAPPDVTRDDLSIDLHNWRQPVLNPLPFPATCVISANDPFASLGYGRRLAAAWGARCIEAGALGHLNGDSGLGDWPQGYALLQELMKDTAHHGH
jgi:predicted alpha/beta hydrolase family esterase